MGNACCLQASDASCASRIGSIGGRALPPAHGGNSVSSICSGGPGVLITGGHDGSAAMWQWCVDGDAGDVVTHRWSEHPGPVTRVAHLPLAGRVLTGCRDGVVRAWPSFDDDTPALTLCGHTLTVTGLDGLEELSAACSGSRDYTLRHWDLHTAKCVQMAAVSRNVVTSLRRCPGECTVVQSSEDLKIRTWDVRDFSSGPCKTLEGHVNIPQCIDVSPCGRYILSCSNGFEGSGGSEVRFWDRRTGKVLQEWRDHDMSVNGCVFLPLPVIGNNDGRIGAASGCSTFDETSLQGRHRFTTPKADKCAGSGGCVNSLAPCVVVTASTDRTVRVFDYSYHRALHTRRFDGYGSSREAGPVLCCAALEPPTVCADNGKAYFAAGDLGGRTQVWVLNREDSMKTGNVRTLAHTTA